MWGLLAVVALLWPARTAGLLDGLPLESTIANAILVGVVFPSLLWFHPRFLQGRAARGAILALLVWKAVGAAVLTTDGWCVRFEPQRPLVKDAASNVPHSWDVRADWLSDQPACSAVVRRAYKGLGEFPVWFFNLPPTNDSWPDELDRPPGARTGMIVSGFIDTTREGVLQLEFTRDMNATAFVDGARIQSPASLAPGVHHVRVEAMLTGDRWRFAPLWNGGDLWRSNHAIATVRRPTRVDELVRPWGGWIVTALVGGLIVAWTASLALRVGSPVVIAWTVAASALLGGLAAANHIDAARWSVLALAGAAFVPTPSRIRNVFGAFVLVGIPWLTLIVIANADNIAHLRIYAWGNDYWMYQRFGYRIVMQGYWLEGGTKVFYFQPFYRWVSGLLHLLFGDSSIGEFFWDGACYLAQALLAFQLTKAAAGFRCGLIAAATTLSVIAVGLGWGLIGGSLSEITSAGFLYVGAFLALRSRRGPLVWAALAGVLASLAFYARLNNLPMAGAIALFGLSARVPLHRFVTRRPAAPDASAWRTFIAWPTIVTVSVVLAAGVLFLAWRNWHFNNVFSVFHGTQRYVVGIWKPGMSFVDVVPEWLDSLLMVITVRDPPVFDWKSLPVIIGAIIAPLAALGVPRVREVPALAPLFFLVGISAAFVARGSAYPGRFSVHIIGITCALTVIAIERLLRPSPATAHIIRGS